MIKVKEQMMMMTTTKE